MVKENVYMTITHASVLLAKGLCDNVPQQYSENTASFCEVLLLFAAICTKCVYVCAVLQEIISGHHHVNQNLFKLFN